MIAWIIRLINQHRVANVEVDVNLKCPACGHRNGKIKFMAGQLKSSNGTKDETFIEHTCQICSAKFYEPTVVKSEAWYQPQAN